MLWMDTSLEKKWISYKGQAQLSIIAVSQMFLYVASFAFSKNLLGDVFTNYQVIVHSILWKDSAVVDRAVLST